MKPTSWQALSLIGEVGEWSLPRALFSQSLGVRPKRRDLTERQAKRFPETRRWEGPFLSDLGLRKPEFDDAALRKISNMLHGMLHGLAVSSGEHREMQGIPMQHECDTKAAIVGLRD
jgi:hypothetical protein